VEVVWSTAAWLLTDGVVFSVGPTVWRVSVRIGATTVETGETGPPTFRLGDQQCIGPPKLLARGFQKARNFTTISIVVTRMQHLASEFSKIFRGWYPRTLTAGGVDSLKHQTPSPAFGRVRCKRRGVGTQTLIPLNFSAVVAPLPVRPLNTYFSWRNIPVLIIDHFSVQYYTNCVSC